MKNNKILLKPSIKRIKNATKNIRWHDSLFSPVSFNQSKKKVFLRLKTKIQLCSIKNSEKSVQILCMYTHVFQTAVQKCLFKYFYCKVFLLHIDSWWWRSRVCSNVSSLFKKRIVLKTKQVERKWNKVKTLKIPCGADQKIVFGVERGGAKILRRFFFLYF